MSRFAAPGCGYASACATVSAHDPGRARGDWRSGSALRSHRRGHWFEPSIAHHPASAAARAAPVVRRPSTSSIPGCRATPAAPSRTGPHVRPDRPQAPSRCRRGGPGMGAPPETAHPCAGSVRPVRRIGPWRKWLWDSSTSAGPRATTPAGRAGNPGATPVATRIRSSGPSARSTYDGRHIAGVELSCPTSRSPSETQAQGPSAR
jgi:hypothetical protein